MSITRSLSRRVPATEPHSPALLLIAHGSERSIGPNRQLCAQVEHLRAVRPGSQIEGAVLYGAPDVGTALEKLGRGTIHVLPMFMCDGLFTRKIIPARIDENRLDGQTVSFGSPVGLSGGLVPLIASRIRTEITAQRQQDHQARVVLVGHGSTRSDASWQTTERHAASLRKRGSFRSVDTAYLDQSPYLADVLWDQNTQGTDNALDTPARSPVRSPTYIVGLFAANGLHAGDDIPALIAGLPDNRDIHYLGAIGSASAMVDLAVAALMEYLPACSA